LKRIHILISCFIWVFEISLASAQSGHSARFDREIEASFFDDGRISVNKVDDHINKSKALRQEIIDNLVRYYEQIGGKSHEKALEKAETSDTAVGYDRLIELGQIIKKAPPASARKIAVKILELGFALRSDGRWMDYEEIAGYAKGFSQNYLVKARNSQQEEAHNLFNFVANRYYTQTELATIKANGGDVSKLHPIADGRFFTDTKIEKLTIKDSYLKDSALFRGVKIDFPDDGAQLEYLELKRSESRIKMDVEAVVNGKKTKYKFKIVSETHSEPTSAALAAALGFNTDPTKSIRNPKLYFSKVSKAEFLRDLESYYGWWEPQWNVVEEGRDAKGEFIVFREGLLEAKPTEISRIGSWSFNKNSSPDLREVRAMSLFMAWVANSDMKEEGQTKLLLKEFDQPENLYYTLNDLGWGFGSFYLPESVNWFKWNPVKKTDEKGVYLNYLTWRWSKLFDGMTYDDARWMIRRMARLSRQQINDAVDLGKWRPDVAKVLVEKLISRRNKFITAFNLENEFQSQSVDFSLAPLDSAIDDFKRFEIDKRLDFSDLMKNPMVSMVGPALLSVETQLVNLGLAKATGEIERTFRFKDSATWNPDFPFASGLILKIRRNVAKNEQPRSINERYLVHDQITIGWVLGAGLIDVLGKATYYRSFNLIYPVKEQRAGLYKPNYLARLLIPASMGLVALPPKYSMFIEDFVEGSGTIRISNKSFFRIGAGASLAKVFLKRFLVDDKGNGSIQVMEDKSQYTRLSAELYAALGFVRFPLVTGTIEQGKIDRMFWKIKSAPEKLQDDQKLTTPVSDQESNFETTRQRLRDSLMRVVGWADMSQLLAKSEKKRIQSDYVTNRFGANLFTLLLSHDSYRKDRITETQSTDGDEKISSLQIQRISEDIWKAPIINIMEEDMVRAFFIGVEPIEGTQKEASNTKVSYAAPVLGLNVKMYDSQTFSKELSSEYVDFVNAASGQRDFISFNALRQTNRDQWGGVLTQFDFLLYEGAIAKLMTVTREQMWEKFEFITGYRKSDLDANQPDLRRQRIVESFQKFVEFVVSAQGPIPRHKSAERLVKAMKSAVVTTSFTAGFKGEVLGVLRCLLGDDDIFISAKIGTPIFSENIFPEGKPLVNRIGSLKFHDPKLHDFSLGGISHVYNFFDSIIPENSQVPSADYPY